MIFAKLEAKVEHVEFNKFGICKLVTNNNMINEDTI